MRIIPTLAFVLLSLSSLRAQTLNDFSAFDNADSTFFSGSWAVPAASTPLTSFSQGAGVYNVVGGTNDSFSGVDYYFMTGTDYTTLDLGTNRFLQLNAMVLSGTTASSITVTLFDAAASTHYASAVFDLSTFSTASYSANYAAITSVVGFDWSTVQGFKISGAMTGETLPLNISFDNLAAVSAVPEPATYAAILGLVTLGLVSYRRFRRR